MLSKHQVVTALRKLRSDEIVITSMSIVRAWGDICDHPLDFASADSAMGHAADFALGVALAQPRRRVVCLTGDGSALMSLGTLATIADSGCDNLLLMVLCNGTYEITGNQPVPAASGIDFAAVARAVGIRHARHTDDARSYADTLATFLAADHCGLISVAVRPGHEPPLGRGPDETLPCLRSSLAASARALRGALTRARQ